MNSVEISAEQFRRLAERVTQLAAEYLDNIDAQKISPAISGEETLRLFATAMPEEGIGDDALNALPDLMCASRVQNGRFFGYVLGSGEPVGAVADLLASVLNQNVTAWRSGPAAVILEQTVVGWLAQAIGCPGFRGQFTGGGSSANLMGLAMARETKMPANEKGIASGGVVYASSEIHMSIPKSIALLGIGRHNLRLIPTDSSFRMIPQKLDAQILEDKAAGKTPIAVVASAGTVSTGAIDPLAQVAEIARRHGVWLHIDGAYGALAAIAERTKFKGWNLRTRFPSTRTSGSTSHWIAAVCSIAHRKRLRMPSRTVENMPVPSAPIRSKDLCFSKSRWNYREDSAPSSCGCRCAITESRHFANRSRKISRRPNGWPKQFSKNHNWNFSRPWN